MKQMIGTVIRLNDPQTVKVEVAYNWQHPIYKKMVKRTKKYLCGLVKDLQVTVGDQVVLKESRPLSRSKHFVVIEKVA